MRIEAAGQARLEDWLKEGLARLSAADLLRDPADSGTRARLVARGGDPIIDACSNDYLGLGARTVSRETLSSIAGHAAGAGASRLVQGTCPEHVELEAELANWLRQPAALLSTSAFALNAGALPALAGPGSLIVSDQLNHASIVDGCRLAKARCVVTPHLDLEAIELALKSRPTEAPTWVVMEALFSMDGDSPDLRALRSLCDRYGAWLYLDEAHSLGVFGPEGAGLAADANIGAEVLVAGLGKAVGSQGGVALGSSALRTWLWNRARSFVFSTAPSPALTQLCLLQVREARAAADSRALLRLRAAELRRAVGALGLTVVPGDGPIIPVVLGSNARALHAMEVLRQHRILAQAIRPPTVPQGQARLRLTAHADWDDTAVPRIVRALEVACAS